MGPRPRSGSTGSDDVPGPTPDYLGVSAVPGPTPDDFALPGAAPSTDIATPDLIDSPLVEVPELVVDSHDDIPSLRLPDDDGQPHDPSRLEIERPSSASSYDSRHASFPYPLFVHALRTASDTGSDGSLPSTPPRIARYHRSASGDLRVPNDGASDSGSDCPSPDGQIPVRPNRAAPCHATRSRPSRL